jgi:hypothetical protein
MQTRRDFLRVLGCGSLAGAFVSNSTACGISPFPALLRGAEFLAKAQGSDGAWRSTRYGFFRDGDALTPLILLVLDSGPQRVWRSDAIERGTHWLRRLTDRLAGVPEPWLQLRYPLFTASYAARVFAAMGDLARGKVWANIITSLQLTTTRNWPKEDPRYGGWSDAPMAPQRPPDGPVPDMLNPNVSATAFAVMGLAAAGYMEEARRAESFLFQCQNFAIDRDQRERHDDGGFIFALGDPVRNKAGAAGQDSRGQRRYRSYGSATCDGLLALLALGHGPGTPRVATAFNWLRDNAVGFEHPGSWPTDRADSARALLYYYAQGLAQVLSGRREPWMTVVRRKLTEGIISAQSPEGSWSNGDPESCEDDPLLATAFAMHALSVST